MKYKIKKEIKMKETERLELKKSTSELKDGIKSICAILNKHKKGKLIFGIKPNGEILGQQISEKTLRDVSRAISDFIEPKIFPKVYEEIIEGEKCVMVEFEGVNVPYYAYDRAYIRVADEDRLLSAKELEKFILEKNKDFWEKQFSEKQLKDIDEKALKEFIKKANFVNRINFDYSNKKDILLKLHLLKEGKLLMVTELLFCKNVNYEMQAAVFAGKDKLTFLDITSFKGNLFDLMEKSISYIKEHMNWRAKLTGEGRVEIPEIPIRAIEEAIVNSLVHRDYSNPKASEIAFFKNRIEIYNLGEFPVGHNPQEYIEGKGESILRNPFTANTLYLSKDIEKWGSGIKRIYELCKSSGVKVEFEKVKIGFKVIFYRKHFQDEGLVEGLVESQRKIIELISRKPTVSKKELSKEIGISTTAIDKNILTLQKKGLIERVGSARGGHWKIR